MLNHKVTSMVAGIALATVATSASAGFAMKDEKSGIGVNLGGRLQTQVLFNDSDRGNNEDTEFKVRRGRIRLGIDAHEMLSMFLQTDVANNGAPSGGQDVRMIDAFITFKPSQMFQLISGLRMAPVTRQNLTSSGALLGVDRPGITNYNLTWGLSGRSAFNNSGLAGAGIAQVGDSSVRDLGVTLFGSGDMNADTHFKYYFGISEGSEVNKPADTERFTGRAQVNFGDAEAGYFNLSTYLGKKDTIAVGIAYDTQDDIAVDAVTGQGVDYSLFTIDAFMDKKVGNGFLTLEGAWTDLDLDDANVLNNSAGAALSANSGKQVQGDGFYIQTGYLMGNWQPFFGYEQWNSDGVADAGSWDAIKGGVTYYFKGHNANVKAGVEKVGNDLVGANDITTAIINFNITY